MFILQFLQTSRAQIISNRNAKGQLLTPPNKSIKTNPITYYQILFTQIAKRTQFRVFRLFKCYLRFPLMEKQQHFPNAINRTAVIRM